MTAGKRSAPHQAFLDLKPPEPDLDHILRSPANADAIDRLSAWQDWPTSWLAVVGPVQSGLSTLAGAFCEASGAVLTDGGQVSAASPDEIDRLAWQGAAVDDAETISDGLALMALLNRAEERGQPIVLFAKQPPVDLVLQPPDVMSRLRAMPVVEIGPPDDGLMRARLETAFRQRFIFLPDGVADILLSRLPRRYAEIERIADRVHRAMSDQRRGLSVALAKEILAEGPGTGELFETLDRNDEREPDD
jgi:chromosomal replication initiation ATPase DnaA